MSSCASVAKFGRGVRHAVVIDDERGISRARVALRGDRSETPCSGGRRPARAEFARPACWAPSWPAWRAFSALVKGSTPTTASHGYFAVSTDTRTTTNVSASLCPRAMRPRDARRRAPRSCRRCRASRVRAPRRSRSARRTASSAPPLHASFLRQYAQRAVGDAQADRGALGDPLPTRRAVAPPAGA